MNGRVGIRIGGAIAVATCALLVACGGGGGGGGVTPQATPTPSIYPATQSASATLSTSQTTAVSLGGVSTSGVNVVNSANVTFPLANNAATENLTLSGALPNNVPAPSNRTVHLKKADTLGVPSTSLAYISLTLSANVTINTSPAFTVTFPSAVSGNVYLVVYDPLGTLGSGWVEVAGPVSASTGTATFASAPLSPPLTLQGNNQYVFAVVTTGSRTIPTPSGSTIPTTAPTSTASGLGSPLPAITAAPQNKGWTPYQVATALQFPAMTGYTGAGQTIAIVGDAYPNQNDLNTFLSTFQINRRGSFSIVPISGGPDGSGVAAGDDGEATLDVETVLALAPDANVLFYAIPNLNQTSFWAAEQYVLSDPNHPNVLNESFGGCEYSGNTTDDTYFAQGVSQKHIAYTASSGDYGNECYNGTDSSNNPIYTPGPNNPASDPNVIAVGGNENVHIVGSSYSLTSLTAPTVWNDTFFQSQGASGGGVSSLFTTLPSYQSGVSGLASNTARNVPDITMPAEAVAVYLQGQWQTFGGTSWGAPIAAALVAEMNQYCGGTGNPTNTVGMFYTARSRNSSAFVDVTSGNNQFGTSTRYYTAVAGYDDATGLGLPLGMPAAQALCPSHIWSYMARSQSMALEAYGASRNTDLNNAANLRGMSDLGARSSDAQTDVWIALRNTPTVSQDEQTVITELKNAGFQITQTFASNLLIQAKAPASTISSYFNTTLHDVSEGRYGTRYANATSMTVPAAIAPYVRAVVADNVIRRHRLSYRIR